jgi:hypothetical protein
LSHSASASFISLSGKVDILSAEDITLQMKDGTRLSGWFVKNIQNGKSKMIIYFGGNAEEVSWMIDEADRFKGWSAVLINYRGYGLSDGKPGEKSLFSDALEIFDYFSNRKGVDSTRMVIMGRSIGTGVAAGRFSDKCLFSRTLNL